MEDAKIIKALECCYDKESCTDCPYRYVPESDGKDCEDILGEDARKLIDRQQADVELYQERANKYEAQVQVLLEQSRSLFEEYEKLRLAARPYLDEIARECGLNRSKSTALEKVEHNSLCETETYGTKRNGKEQ